MPLSAANLVTKATDVPPLQLSAGKAFPKEPIVLEAGKYLVISNTPGPGRVGRSIFELTVQPPE